MAVIPKKILYNGKNLTVAQWVIEHSHVRGMSEQIIHARLRMGWEIGKILNTPSRTVVRHLKAVKPKGIIHIDSNNIEYDELLHAKRLVNQVGEVEAIKRIRGLR